MSEEIQDKGGLKALILCAVFVITAGAGLAHFSHSKPVVKLQAQVAVTNVQPTAALPFQPASQSAVERAKPKTTTTSVAVTTAPAVTTTLPPTTTTVPDSALSPMDLAHRLSNKRFGESQWPALQQLWVHESGFKPTAHNSSGACGIPQALPCSKIKDMSVRGQILWGLDYIAGNYGTPAKAWAFWLGPKPKGKPQGNWY